ncbi:MAG: response regulator transcription factor [Blastocatellia bacterium]|nr:response regulator transcription factor [Blastocatellia bacterium]
MKKRRILVIDDDPKIVASIKLYLEHAGFAVAIAYNGREALEQARAHLQDLIVLDLMLPEIGGLDVCRILRAESDVPIIMLTARTTEEDKLRGLDLGADDYVSKPFSPRELVARVRAVLRRSGQTRDDSAVEIRFDDLVIDLNRHEVKVCGQIVYLTPTEFKLLEIFVKAPERAFTRRELVERAFGWDYDGMERTVDVHVKNLRKKIAASAGGASYVSTVFGVGYKFSRGRA